VNELRALYGADDAVSSVLGVVLMVAVTIILAAVIGTFVLGIGADLTDSSPSTQWEFSENLNGSGNGSLVILHGGGEDVDKSDIEITIGGTAVYENGADVSGDGFSVVDNAGDPMTSGDRLVIEEDGTQFNKGDMVRVIWQTEDSSNILAEERLG
jgi:FlaG/FlaF family flagellin (archaellin)